MINLIFIISLIFSFKFLKLTNSLQLEIKNLSNKLTNLSVASIPNSNILSLTQEILKNEPLWPFLIAFSKAKCFNDNSVLIRFFDKLSCDTLFSLIFEQNFPMKQIMTSELIASSSNCLACLTTKFYENYQQIIENPLESIIYLPSLWNPSQHTKFLEIGYDFQTFKTNWYSWCRDPNLTVNYFIENRPIWTKKLWKTISFYCLNDLAENLNEELLKILSPDEELLQFNINDNMIRSRALTFFNHIVHQHHEPSIEEIDFAVNQIMRVITMLTYLVTNNVSLLRFEVLEVLDGYLRKLKANHRKFPKRKKLKKLLHYLLTTNQNIKLFLRIDINLSETLIELMEFCRGHARGPWLLNVIIIWDHFRDKETSPPIKGYVNRFLDSFFAVEYSSSITAVDACLFIRLIKSLTSRHDENFDDIIDQHLLNRPDLISQLFKNCLNVISKSQLIDFKLFTVNSRVEHLLKITRSVDDFNPAPFYITFGRAENIFTSIARKYCQKLKDKETRPDILLPLNVQFTANNFKYEGNITELFKIFFKSLLDLDTWFSVRNPRSNDDNALHDKPILIPSLLLPPQLMEPIGFFIGRAVSANVEIPFIIEENYFELWDTYKYVYDYDPNSEVLNELYPQTHTYTTNLQVYLSIKYANLALSEIFIKMHPKNEIFFFDNAEMEIDVNCINNSDSDMKTLILMGLERFWVGLNLAIPTDLLDNKNLYNLIFKK